MVEGMYRPISSYSRGMRQRTKLAQAISHEPELLILDEPLSGLDPIGRAQMTELLRNWIAMGRSIIIASHVLHEIEALTQSFLLISGGRVLASGTAEEVHELLFDVPLEIHVRCNDLRGFAAKTLGAAELADSAKIKKDKLQRRRGGAVDATRQPNLRHDSGMDERRRTSESTKSARQMIRCSRCSIL